jgi:cold shock CspA family protein
MAVGRVIRFDESRGYGFIVPVGGGEDVFVHANDFGSRRHLVHPGMRVEYEAEESDRGLKVKTISSIGDEGEKMSVTTLRTARAGENMKTTFADDDALCDVLSPREFSSEITELLIQRIPTLTGAQIAQVREYVVDLARTHGWVES